MNLWVLKVFCMAPPPPQGRERGSPLLEKGKPAARRGRKATGQAASLTAGLPKEGWPTPPRTLVVSPEGRDHTCFGQRERPSISYRSAFSWAESSSEPPRLVRGSSMPPGLLPRRIPTEALSRIWRPIASTTDPLNRVRERRFLRLHPRRRTPRPIKR